MTTIQPGTRVRLDGWPRFHVVSAVRNGKLWLNDDRGGVWSYGVGLRWQIDDGKPDWIQWRGGEAPTTEPVEIRLRDGRCIEMPVECRPDWRHTGANSDILFWRELQA